MPIVPATPEPPPRRKRATAEVRALPPALMAQQPVPAGMAGLLDPYDGPSQAATQFPDRYRVLYDIDPAMAEEHALDTLSRLVMSRMSPDQCAKTLAVSIRQIHKWRRDLRTRLSGAIKKLDIHDMMGGMMEEVSELRATGWREVQAAQSVVGTGVQAKVVVDWKRRQSGADLVMKAHDRMIRMLAATGALDSAPLRGSIDTGNSDEGRTNALQKLAENFLSGSYNRGAVVDASTTPLIDEDD